MKIDEEENSEKQVRGYKIKFDNVTFRYPNSQKNVLSNISFEIAENEKVAIVGKNGSGKVH